MMDIRLKKYHKIWNKHHPEDQKIIGDGFVIHHIDGNNKNNDINNLIKITQSEHASLHFKDFEFTNEHRAKIGLKHKNKTVSNETRSKLSKAAKGRILDEEWKNKIKISCKKKKASEITKHRISNSKKGDKNPASKLTWSTVEWIRDILGSEEYQEAKKKKLISQKRLAVLFGVNQNVISEIKINKSWKVENNDAYIG